MDALIAYDAMAPIYDAFTTTMTSRGAKRPAAASLALWFAGGPVTRRGLWEGKELSAMFARGWDAVGCGISAEMLRLAREKTDGAVQLERVDIHVLPCLGSFISFGRSMMR